MADNDKLPTEATVELIINEPQPAVHGEEAMEISATDDPTPNKTEPEAKTDDPATKLFKTEASLEADSDIEAGNGKRSGTAKLCTDMYAYTKDGKFTSEIFKIEIKNLPSGVGFGQLKKRLLSLNLKPVKIKIVDRRAQQCFVTFRNDTDRDEAITKCTDHLWKGRTWTVKKALPAADPLVRKRQLDSENEAVPHKKVPKEDPDLPAKERLNQAVTPLYHLPYEEQLQKKQDQIATYLKKLGHEIQQNHSDHLVIKYLAIQRKLNEGLICPLEAIKKSPEIYGYRNKCEFSIGRSPDGEDNTVGFRLGRYNRGIITVVEVDECIHVPESMKKVTKALQKYLRETSQYAGYNPEERSGHWRQLTLRTNSHGSIMAMVAFHPQALSKEEVAAEREQVAQYFQPGGASGCDITSMYFIVETDRVSDPKQEEHVFGDAYIEEELLGIRFRISPVAFFQVNAGATEVLYSTVAEWSSVSDKTVLLDVCCGTGTIGLTMAKCVARTVGVELCSEAIEDAKVNAQINEIKNAQFHCSKAEVFLPSYMRSLYGVPVVAVVDPPRGGLHGDVVRGIRKCKFIKRVIYVSCNPNGAKQNIIDFTRQESKRMTGEPFRLVRAVAVDLFPHTPHCELVMMLDRQEIAAQALHNLQGVQAEARKADVSEHGKAEGSKDLGKAEESGNDSAKVEGSEQVSVKVEGSEQVSVKVEGSEQVSVKVEGSEHVSVNVEGSEQVSIKTQGSEQISVEVEGSEKDSVKAQGSQHDLINVEASGDSVMAEG